MCISTRCVEFAQNVTREGTPGVLIPYFDLLKRPVIIFTQHASLMTGLKLPHGSNSKQWEIERRDGEVGERRECCE